MYSPITQELKSEVENNGGNFRKLYPSQDRRTDRIGMLTDYSNYKYFVVSTRPNSSTFTPCDVWNTIKNKWTVSDRTHSSNAAFFHNFSAAFLAMVQISEKSGRPARIQVALPHYRMAADGLLNGAVLIVYGQTHTELIRAPWLGDAYQRGPYYDRLDRIASYSLVRAAPVRPEVKKNRPL